MTTTEKWMSGKEQLAVCDCGYSSSHPDDWQDHGEACDQAYNAIVPYII